MELTPDERRLIYEEEKARLEAQGVIGSAKKRIVTAIFGGCGILLVVIAAISAVDPFTHSGTSGPSQVPTQSSSSNGERTVRGAYWCADSYEGAMWIAVAVRDNDAQALRGLIVRGKAFEVEKGTRMIGAGSTGGVFTGVIESGAHIGRKCYFSTNALE
jgi:hypothetical protein